MAEELQVSLLIHTDSFSGLNGFTDLSQLLLRPVYKRAASQGFSVQQEEWK